MKKTSISRKIFLVFLYVFMVVYAVACIIPFIHVLFASFSDPMELLSTNGMIIRIKGFNLEGYKIVFGDKSIWRGYLNTILYCAGCVVVGMFITITGAYVTSRKDFMFRNVLSLFIAVTMLFSAGIIPGYMVVRTLHLYNTIFAIIIPGSFSVFNMIMLRSAFSSLPESLSEAARLDGANDWVIIFRILLPLSKATIAVLVMYTVLAQWNSWFNASIYLKDKNLYPLQLVIQNMMNSHQSASVSGGSMSNLTYSYDLYDELVQYCTVVVSMVPIMIAFPFVFKYFESGVMIGAIKE